MKKQINYRACLGQTAVEYLLILAVVGVIVLVGFQSLIPKVHDKSETYYTSVADVILGNKQPEPINGGWCEVRCPTVKGEGNPTMYRTCECPAPAFGGLYCTDPKNPASSNPGAEGNCQGDTCTCSKEKLVSACIPDGHCSALEPACGQVTFGHDNCQGVCTRQGPACPH